MADRLQRALNGLATVSAGLGVGAYVLSESLYNGERAAAAAAVAGVGRAAHARGVAVRDPTARAAQANSRAPRPSPSSVHAPRACCAVDGGHRAVIWNRFSGGIQDTVVGEGTHFRIPLVSYPTMFDV